MPSPSPLRRALVRVVAALAALSWLLVPGFALPDIGVTVAGSPEWQPVAALEAGWGVLALVLAATFLRLALVPARAAPLLLVCSAPLPALVLGAVLGDEAGLWLYVAVLAGQIVLLALCAGAGPRQLRLSVSRPMLLLAGAAAAPCVLYAVRMLEAGRAGALPQDLTMGVDHWAMQAAAALGLLLVLLTGALVEDVRAWSSCWVAAAAAWVAVTSLRFPASAAAWAPVWSWLALGWSAAVVAAVVAERAARRSEGRRRQAQDAGSSQT